jgi:hypothetical protein
MSRGNSPQVRRIVAALDKGTVRQVVMSTGLVVMLREVALVRNAPRRPDTRMVLVGRTDNENRPLLSVVA